MKIKGISGKIKVHLWLGDASDSATVDVFNQSGKSNSIGLEDNKDIDDFLDTLDIGFGQIRHDGECVDITTNTTSNGEVVELSAYDSDAPHRRIKAWFYKEQILKKIHRLKHDMDQRSAESARINAETIDFLGPIEPLNEKMEYKLLRRISKVSHASGRNIRKAISGLDISDRQQTAYIKVWMIGLSAALAGEDLKTYIKGTIHMNWELEKDHQQIPNGH